MKAWLNGLGWVTAAGLGRGRQAKVLPFCGGELTIPTRKQVFAQPDMRFGRLDPFSRIGLAAIAFCLRDADQEEWQQKRPIGIIAGSRYGCLPTDLTYLETMLPEQGKLASPNLFAYTLPNSFLGEAALRFGLTGNSLVLNRTDRSGLAALKYALEDLAWNDQQGVLAGVCDLVAPAGIGSPEDCPGSLFLLLETAGNGRSYGELELAEDRLFFAGTELSDLPALVSACLAINSSGSCRENL